MTKKTAPKLTAAQKRDRDIAALIAGIQMEYEAKIEQLVDQHRIEVAKTATENYGHGFENGYNAAAAVADAQSVIDRLLKKAI